MCKPVLDHRRRIVAICDDSDAFGRIVFWHHFDTAISFCLPQKTDKNRIANANRNVVDAIHENVLHSLAFQFRQNVVSKQVLDTPKTRRKRYSETCERLRKFLRFRLDSTRFRIDSTLQSFHFPTRKDIFLARKNALSWDPTQRTCLWRKTAPSTRPLPRLS